MNKFGSYMTFEFGLEKNVFGIYYLMKKSSI